MSSEPQNLLISIRNGVRTILFNRPEKLNAFSHDMYSKITEILNADAKNDKVTITILSGVGKFYSSGADLKSSAAMSSVNNGDRFLHVKDMINAFINYPKLLIAVVNGPAIGIAATITALCDIAYATDNAYFSTPFIKLALCCEGTSSYLFPRILGRSKSSEILLLGEILTVADAYKYGLISKIIPQKNVHKFIESLHKYGELPLDTLMRNKSLIISSIRNTLLETNEKEIANLHLCIESEDFTNAMIKMLQKSKL